MVAASRGFFAELRRRNVLRAAVLYAGAVWALAQGIAQLGPTVGAPEWITRWFLVAAVIGFPFWIAFAWWYALTPTGIKRERDVAPDDSIAHATGRKLDFAIIGVLALAVVLLLTDRLVTRAPETQAISAASVAVLPFDNESGNPEDLYFSDGLSDNLIIALSQFAGLKVISRESSFKFRDSSEDSEAIGAKLGVAHLLEGSVQRLGDQVRISTMLVNAADGSTTWSQRYYRPYKDLFTLQNDITNAVANALRVHLLPGLAGHQDNRPPGGNIAAYDALLRGNAYASHGTADGVRKSIAQYRRAIAIDPDYAWAWANLAFSQDQLGFYYAIPRDEQQKARAGLRESAARALQLAPDLAHAHLAQVRVLDLLDNGEGVLQELRRAQQLAPHNSEVIAALAYRQALLGRILDAIASFRRAIALSPLSYALRQNLGMMLTMVGRYDEAATSIRKAIEFRPEANSSHSYLAIALLLGGHTDEAVTTAMQEPDPFWRHYALALSYWSAGDHARSEQALRWMIKHYADAGGSQIAAAYAQRGQPDAMFHWLQHAVDTGDGGVREIRIDPFIVRYRNDARYLALVRKLKLEDPGAGGAEPALSSDGFASAASAGAP